MISLLWGSLEARTILFQSAETLEDRALLYFGYKAQRTTVWCPYLEKVREQQSLLKFLKG